MIKLAMLCTVEERFGDQAAADCLMSAAQFLVQGLHPGDQLFQWSSDVLTAVIRRQTSSGAVRIEVSRLFMDPPQHLIEQGGRKTMVNLAFRFDMLPLAQLFSLDEMMSAFEARMIDVS